MFFTLSMHINYYTSLQDNKTPFKKIMNKLILPCFLVLLALPLRLADKEPAGNFDLYTPEDDDDDFESIDSPDWESDSRKATKLNVDAFGAVGDGESDDTQAFKDAWKQACSKKKSVFVVPEGGRYLVHANRFKGPCADKITIQIDGTIVAPDDPKKWDRDNLRTWLGFYNLSKVTFQGKGVIDGSGSKWWAASCKRNKSNRCKGAPTALTIDSSSGVRVKDLTIRNGQQMHFVIGRSELVRVTGVTVSAPEDSPNTDGIHITESTNVVIQNSKIGIGDDCISIVNASSNIKMKNIYCGPGHGISIGSLGKNNSTGIVEKVVLDTAFIHDTTNGLRIKTWQGGSGYVRAVRYQDVKMDNVSNPIIIDQFYCDSPITCENQTSAVEIDGIMFKNISGTSNSRIAIKFACSDTVPCTNIVLNNINLQRENDTVETYCHNAIGSYDGKVQPSADCLLSSVLQEREDVTAKTSTEHIIHTEL